jgi:peptidoglycan/LPS O-acetylase OafA/YrhL
MRSDIQGMRAIAILLVLLYHAGLPVPGGFLGVDVFFVITGFVISNTLIDEYNQTGQISIWNFYQRRFLRLFPPLAVVTITTLLLSILFESPFGYQLSTAKSALAALFLNANTYFFLNTGYFDITASTNPLLHTWSLSVEEQIYLILPFVFLLGLRESRIFKNRVVLTGIVLVLLFSSLIFSVLTTYNDKHGLIPAVLGQQFAFYSPATRLWQILFGVLVALSLNRQNIPTIGKADMLGSAGGFLVVSCGIFLNDQNRIPGIVSVIPVLGSVLMIIAGSNKNSFIHKFLSTRFLVAIGNRSYSVYLWHWPFVVLSRAIFPNLDHVEFYATLASIFPAIASYRWIEVRFRKTRMQSKHIHKVNIIRLTVVPLILISVMIFGVDNRWWVHWDSSYSDEERIAKVGDCIDAPFDPIDCAWNQEGLNGSIVLVGDSQAFSYADGVVEAAIDLDHTVTISSLSGCPFLSQSSNGDHYLDCSKWQKEVLLWITSQSPKAVFIANRSYGYTRLQPPWRTVKDGQGNMPRNSEEAFNNYEDGLIGVISKLARRNIPVVILQNIPEVHVIKRGESLFSKLINRTSNDSFFGFDIDNNERIRRYESKLTTMFSNVYRFDPYKVFCENSCLYTYQGREIYLDSFHLTRFGSITLAPEIRKVLIQIGE